MNKNIKIIALGLLAATSFTVTTPAGPVLALVAPTPLPETIHYSPSSGEVGTVVTLTGGNFDHINYPSTSTIWFTNGSYSSKMNPLSSDAVRVTAKVPSSLCPGAESESCSSNFSKATAKGVYMIYIKTPGVPDHAVEESFTVTGPGDDSTLHPAYSNIVGPDGTVYQLLSATARWPYTSAGAFLSYKFNSWKNVLTANKADMALPVAMYTPSGSSTQVPSYIQPRNGSLINDKGTVYIISGGLRYGFSSSAVFTGMGFSFSNVYPGDTSFMVTGAVINSSEQIHPNGTLINQDGTIYVMQNGNRVGFPNMTILDSWGYWITDAVSANSYDRKAPASGVMQTRMENQMNI